MSHEHCQILFNASRALVEKSGLANYTGCRFVACDDQEEFNRHWEREFHGEFGRYMAWVLFLVGAENLAKAACVCSVVVKMKHKPTLEKFVDKHFRELPGLCDGDKDRLIEGYKKLTDVRNRDAHSYRRDVRSTDFPLVAQTFVPAFNILLKAMRKDCHRF